MEKDNNKIKYFGIEIFLAKLYLFFIPFRISTFIVPFFSKYGGFTKYLDFILLILGIFFIFIKKISHKSNYNKNKLFDFAKFMLIIWGLISLLMSVYFDLTFGKYAGESSYSAVLNSYLYFVEFFMMIIYNRELFKLLGFDEINKILSKMSIVVLIIGYLQLLVSFGPSFFQTLYNKIDFLDLLEDNVLTTKIPLTETEGALAANLLSIFILPFLASNVMVGKNAKINNLQLLLWLPIIISSCSLTSYILCGLFYLVYILYYLKTKKEKKTLLITILIIIFSVFMIKFTYNFLPQNIKSIIDYNINSKINDKENGSTVSRTEIPLKLNWGVFKKFPIFGAGNGNQGYFYYDFVDAKYVLVPGVKTSYLNAGSTIYNGILFFPSILSGYGIVGFSLLLLFIVKSNRSIKSNKTEMQNFYYFYEISKYCILIAGFQTLFVGCFYIFFVVSMPIIAIDRRKDD